MMLSIIEQIISLLMVQESVRFPEELFLMSASVSTTVEDINTTILKGVMKNRDIKEVFSKFRHFFIFKCFS